MDIQATKIKLAHLILDTDKEQVLRQIQNIFQNETRISVEQYNQELDEADAEIDNGEFITHEDLKREMKKW